MPEITLTQGRIAVVDDVDLEWALTYSWHVTNDYPARAVWKPRRRTFYMHREIAIRAGILEAGDDRLTDHENGDHFDNRRSNLRAADFCINNSNRRPVGVSGFLGVCRARSGWAFEIQRYGRRIRKAGFATPADAAEARARVIAEENL